MSIRDTWCQCECGDLDSVIWRWNKCFGGPVSSRQDTLTEKAWFPVRTFYIVMYSRGLSKEHDVGSTSEML